MPAPSNILPYEREYFLRMADGDESAFAEIFYHYSRRIYPFVNKMTRSIQVSEEIIQDVFVSLWKNRESLPGINNYTSYIFTIASNKTYNYLKQKAREHRNLHEFMLTHEDITNNTLETINLNQRRKQIDELVNKMSPQKKLIYKLTREDGLSHEEISQLLNISKNTVKNHLVEILRFLRKNLKGSQNATFLMISFITKANL